MYPVPLQPMHLPFSSHLSSAQCPVPHFWLLRNGVNQDFKNGFLVSHWQVSYPCIGRLFRDQPSHCGLVGKHKFPKSEFRRMSQPWRSLKHGCFTLACFIWETTWNPLSPLARRTDDIWTSGCSSLHKCASWARKSPFRVYSDRKGSFLYYWEAVCLPRFGILYDQSC